MGTETISPHSGICRTPVISLKWRLGAKRKSRANISARTPQISHPNHVRPVPRNSRMNQTSETTTTEFGKSIQRSTSPHCAGVCVRIRTSSSPAQAAAASALIENTKLVHESRARSQMSRCSPAKVRQIPAVIDQMTVTQFID